MLYNQDGSLHIPFPNNAQQAVLSSCAVYPFAAARPPLGNFPARDQALSQWLNTLQTIGYPQLLENCVRPQPPASIPALAYTPAAPPNPAEPYHSAAPAVSSSHLSEVEEQEGEECEEAAEQLYDESSFLVPLVQDPSPASYQKDFWSSDGYVDPYERVSGQTPNTVLRSCRPSEHKSSRFHSLSDPSRSQSATAKSTDPIYTAVMKQNCSPAAPFNLEGRIEACHDDRSHKDCQGPNAHKPSQIAVAASSHPGAAAVEPPCASEPQHAASRITELDSQAAQPCTNDRIAIATGTDGRSGCERGECVSQDGREDERVSQDMKTEDDPLAQSTDAKNVSREVMKLMNIDMKWQNPSQQSGSRRSARNKSAVAAEVDKRPSVSTKKVIEQEVAVTPQPAAATRNSGRTQNSTPQQAPMQRVSAEDEERERVLPAQPAAVLHLAIALRRDANMQRESGTISKRMLTCGLLCGQPVHYHRASKNFACSGWIGSAATILCDCKSCKGKAEVSLTLFEIHAGSAYKRPTEGIFLTNFGVSLKDLSIIVQLLNEEDSLESGPCVNCSDAAAADVRCFGCLSSFHSGCITGSKPARAGAIWFCEHCVQAQQTADYIPPDTAYKLLLTHGSSSPSAATSAPTPKRPRLAAEASGNKSMSMGAKAVSTASKQVKVRMTLMAPSQRSRSMARAHQTRVNRHKHLFAPEAGVLQDGEQLRYMAGGQVLLTGMAVIRGDVRGIHCDHCKEVISPSAFEYHAGRGQARKPYDNIYIDDDVPLTRVAQHRGVELPEENDIPYTVKTSSFPNRRVRRRPKQDADESDVEDEEEEEEEDGTVQQIMDDTLGTGCALCQQRDFQKGGFGDRTIMICDQCEREYHVGCLREHGLCDLQALPEGDWFCSGQCEKIRTRLNAQVKAGDAPINEAHSWHLMRGKDGNPATTKDLKIVHEILQGSFDPIIDQVSGKDLLPKMIYAQSFGEWDYTGMYAMLLRHKGKPVCSAIFRVFGDMLAELPLIATRHDARRKGHCRVLLNTLETLLKEAGVRNLTMPAAHETVATWKGGFGFLSISRELQQLTEEDVRILVFPGTEMLSKELIPSTSTSRNPNTTSVPPSGVSLANHHVDTTPAPATVETVITAPAGQQHNPYPDVSTLHQTDALAGAGKPGPLTPADSHVPDARSGLLHPAAKSSNLDREVHSQHKRGRSNEDDVAYEAGGKRSRLSLSGKSTETTIKTERAHTPLSHMPGTNSTSHAQAPDSMPPSQPYLQHTARPSDVQVSHSNLHAPQHSSHLDSNSPVENHGSNLSASSTVVLAPVVPVQSPAHGDISKEVSSAAGHSTGLPEHANASHHTTAEQTASPTDSERPSKRPCTNTQHHGNTHTAVTFPRDTPTQVGQYGTHSMTHPPGLMPAALPDSKQQAASNGGVFNMPSMQQMPGMHIHPHRCVTSAAHPLYHASITQHASSLSAFLSPGSMVHSQHPALQALPGALHSTAHAKSVPQGPNRIDVSVSNGGKAFDEKFSSSGQYGSGNMAQSLGGLPKNTPWAFMSGNGSPPGTSEGKQRGSDSGTTLRKSFSNG